MKGILLIIFNLFLIVPACFSQVNECHKSTEGTEFWFGFMESRNHQGEHRTEITLTSLNSFNYSIYIGNVHFKSESVQANSPKQIVIPWQMVEAIGSETVQDKAIHLVSDQPINVYALNYSNASSDVALIYPKESLGQEYYAICYSPVYVENQQGKTLSKNSEFLIVASENDTEVKITPKVVTDRQNKAGESITVILDEGQIYQVQSANLNGLAGQGDLTGSHITSNKPVAVFSGTYSTSIPNNDCCYDHLYEQIPPVQTWGRKFLAVPLKTRGKDYYRVMASDINTTVYIGNNNIKLTEKGDFHEFILNYDQACFIESDKPVLLAQYSASNEVDRPPGVSQNDWDGDPFMVIVSPINQTREKVAFVAYNSNLIKEKYFINVAIKDEAIGFINLDTSPIPTSEFISIPGSGYSYAQLNISSGHHAIESLDPDKGFTAYVYGFGGVESYGYGVGFSLDILLDIGRGEIDENGRKFVVRCDGADPITLNAGNAFDTFEWSTGETTPSIQVTDPGTYHVTARTKEGCELRDTVKIVISKPLLNLGNDTTICNPENLLLDGTLYEKFDEKHDRADSYLWKTPVDEVTTQEITAAVPGIYNLKATSKHGCIATDEIKVNFTDVPKLNLSNLDALVCGRKSALLDLSADKGNYTLERADNGERFTDLNAVVPAYGSYPFKFTATDQYGCSSNTTFDVAFRRIPTVDFSIDSTKCYHYNLDVKYQGDADKDLALFTWVFGGETIASGVGVDEYSIELGINRNKRDLTLTVLQEGCSNSDTIKDIKVIPNLDIEIADTLGCEPFTAQFTAHNTETVYYDWDYGDGMKERNSSNPSHTYTEDGYYNVKLKVTTVDKGCTNSITIDSMLYVAPIPTVGFTRDSLECLDLSKHEISYLGSGNTKDTYYWNLSSFDPEEIIQSPDTTQGPFIFNLKNKPASPLFLHVVSEYGCRSDTAKITLKRIPSFTMKLTDNEGCVPLETTFEGIVADSVDKVDFTWDFGDGVTGPGSITSYTYFNPGNKYNITLRALSSLTGCSDTLRKDTLVFTFPKPDADFTVDHPIVYNDKPDVNFTDQSSGAKNYNWDFGDNTTSFEQNPFHKFGSSGYKKVLLEVFNEYSCSDTVSQNVLVAFSRIFPPNAFSPNAPNAIDREFKLNQEAIREEGYKLVILSRWNDIVFETKNEIKGWDGRMKNGSFAPAGNYVWILDYIDFLGRTHRQTGTVTLIF